MVKLAFSFKRLKAAVIWGTAGAFLALSGQELTFYREIWLIGVVVAKRRHFKGLEDGMTKCQLLSWVTLAETHTKSNSLTCGSSVSLHFACFNSLKSPVWPYYWVNEASKTSRDSDEHPKCSQGPGRQIYLNAFVSVDSSDTMESLLPLPTRR